MNQQLLTNITVNNTTPIEYYSFLLSSDISGHVIKSSVVFNPLEKSSSAVESEEDSELKGPVVS